MKNEIHFDVDKITSIKIMDRRPTEYIWHDEVKEVKAFFGLITKVKYLQEGFYGHGCRYSSTEMREYGYLIDGYSSFNPPYVEIYLGKPSIVKKFNSYVEAQTYVDGLKFKTGNKFEIIKYE